MYRIVHTVYAYFKVRYVHIFLEPKKFFIELKTEE